MPIPVRVVGGGTMNLESEAGAVSGETRPVQRVFGWTDLTTLVQAVRDRLPAALVGGRLNVVDDLGNTVLDAISALIAARLPAALVSGRLSVDVGASALATGAATELAVQAVVTAVGTVVTRLTEIRDNALVSTSITLAIPSANTTLNAFASQAVKTPVHISLRKGCAPVTISDGSGVDSILEWDDTNGHHTHMKIFYVANLSQLSYQFSVNDGAQIIEVQAGN